MKVVTWNVNSVRQRAEQVLRFLIEEQPDVLCLQETKCQDHQFPGQAFADAGWSHQAVYGQKTYNGVAILSKYPLVNVQKGHSLGETDPQTRLIAATIEGVRIINCYVPMGTSPSSDKFRYKLEWLVRLRAELNQLSPSESVLVCGDLNITRSDLDTWDPFSTDGKILCHPHERLALKTVMDWGLIDVFRDLKPVESVFSWWDYRGGSFPKNKGFRIDYLLLSQPLVPRAVAYTHFRHTRAWDTPSDHIPVMVELK